MDRENLNQQLLEAVKQGDTGRMWELVEQGADINARGEWGWTALMWLAKKGHLTPELLKALTSHGADINAQGMWGETALMESAAFGHLIPELLDAFIEHRANINARDAYGNTTLMWAAREGHLTPELLEAIVSSGADVNARNRWERTALILATGNGYLTPELARAFAEQFIRLDTPLEEIQKQLPASKETPAILVPVLIDKLESEPGLVVDFMKKHVGKKLQEWVDNGVEGADILVSRLSHQIKQKELMNEGSGVHDMDFF